MISLLHHDSQGSVAGFGRLIHLDAISQEVIHQCHTFLGCALRAWRCTWQGWIQHLEPEPGAHVEVGIYTPYEKHTYLVIQICVCIFCIYIYIYIHIHHDQSCLGPGDEPPLSKSTYMQYTNPQKKNNYLTKFSPSSSQI